MFSLTLYGTNPNCGFPDPINDLINEITSLIETEIPDAILITSPCALLLFNATMFVRCFTGHADVRYWPKTDA